MKIRLKITERGNRHWGSLETQIHRIGGPSMECHNGYKAWCQNGKKHRIKGPALEGRDGIDIIEGNNEHKLFYLDDIKYNQTKYEEELFKRKKK